MKIEWIELRVVEVKLRFRFETSFGAEQELAKLLVTVGCEGVTGHGEATVGNTPLYSSETVDTAWTVLERYIAPRVLGREFRTAAQLLDTLAPLRGHNMAVAALENAFWDCQGKALGAPLWVLLGGTRKSVEVGASLGIQESARATIDTAIRHLGEGYRRIKFKIKPGWDVEPLRAVRDALPDVPLTVDANSAYTLSDARVFTDLDQLRLDYIEQPLAHDDLIDHAALQARLITPLCLDESIHSPEDARKALHLPAARVINIKQGRMRGLHHARQAHDVATSFGVPVWCGGMLELGIGRALNLHLSSLPGFTLPGDTASASRYWEEDVIEERLEAVDGVQQLPESPGVGVTVRHDLIERLTRKVATFGAKASS